MMGWDLTVYHYTVMRQSQGGPWKLVKAWRTDAAGKLMQEIHGPVINPCIARH
jgi:hypothetical protein